MEDGEEAVTWRRIRTTLDQRLRSKEGLIPLKPLAQLIGFHYHTVYGWVAADQIPYVRIGTRIEFDPTVVADWLMRKSTLRHRHPPLKMGVRALTSL
jgi:predicted DNA-binding transcriptional regulator AlpA